MLPSEELLNKYRNSEKNDTPAPESVNSEAATSGNAETNAVTEQPATAGEGKAEAETRPNADEPGTSSESEKDTRTRYQRDFEKRLKRQERSHQEEKTALLRRIEALENALKQNKPELKPEDFESREKYDEYKESLLRESIKKEILEEQRRQKESDDALAEQTRVAQDKLKATFRSPEAVADFQQRLGYWVKDEAEFLDSENGQLFQEFLDSSKLGLVMTDLLMKNPEAMGDFKNCSKDMMLHLLERFETGLIQKAKAMAEAAKKNAADPAPKANTKPAMPSTGDVGKTPAASGKFNARDWLRQNRPDRYK